MFFMRGTKLNRKHIFIYETFRPLLKIYLWMFFDFKCEKVKKRKENYIVLANHATDYDPLMVACSFRKQMYFVASEHIARWGWLFTLVDFLVAPIMRYKGTVAASTAIEILKKIKAGHNVCVFAEGARTWDGMPSPILPSTAKLIKKAGCGLYTYKLTGGYFASPMWAGSGTRRGPVCGAPVRYYSKEELQEMTADEVYKAIVNDLYEDAYARQIENPKPYKGKNLAENLESLMFICPACGKKDVFESSGDKVYCKECGLTYTYDEYGMLHGGKFTTVKEFSDWQKEQIHTDVLRDVVYSSKDGILSTVKDHIEEPVTTGGVSISLQGFKCGEACFELSHISEMAMHGQRALVFTADKKYYELIPSREANALKFYLYYLEWQKIQEQKSNQVTE